MVLTADQEAFVRDHPSAAMITVGRDGYPKPARVAVTLLDGRLLSSGTTSRVRTRRLRRNPACTLFHFDATFRWLGVETTVSLVEGDEGLDLSVRLFRQMQGKPDGPLSWFGGEHDEPAFREVLAREGRLVYEFAVVRAYGMV